MRDKREDSSSRPERSGERRSSGDSERRPYTSSEGDSGSGQKGYFARKRDEGDSKFSRGDSPRGERSSYSSGGGYQGRSDGERKPYASRDDNRTPRTDDTRKVSPYSSGGGYQGRGESDDARKSSFSGRDGGERKPYASRDDNRTPRSDDRGERKPYSSTSGGYQGRSDRDGERKPYASRDDNRSPRSDDRGERKPYSSTSGGYQGRSDRDDSRKTSFGSRDGGERKPYASRDDNRTPRSDDRGERKPYSSTSGGYQGRSDRDDSRKSSFGSRDGGERKPYASRDDNRSPRSDDRGERKPYSSTSGGYQGRGDRDDSRKTSFGREERKPYSRDGGYQRDENRKTSFGGRDEGKTYSRDDSDRPSKTKKESFETSYEEKNAAKMIDRNSIEDETRNTYIYGRHPVIEALKGETAINKVWIGEGTRDTDQIVQYIKDKDIPYKIVSKMKLSYMVGEDTNHQGVVAEIAAREYTDLHDLVELAKQKQVFYIILDKVEDPHNLGAVIRTADAVGADAVIISKHRAVGLTGIVTKASAGAIDRMKVCRVSNLNQAMEELKKANVWIVGVDMEGTEVYSSANLKGSIALAMGGEGEGLTKLVKENCDFIVKIPMHSQSNSLNVSVATAVVSYEIFKQRDYKTVDAVQGQPDVSTLEAPVAPQADVEVEAPASAPQADIQAPVAAPDLIVADVITQAGNIDVDI